MSFSDRPLQSYWKFSTALGALVATIGAVAAIVTGRWGLAAFLAALAVVGAVTVFAMFKRAENVR